MSITIEVDPSDPRLDTSGSKAEATREFVDDMYDRPATMAWLYDIEVHCNAFDGCRVIEFDYEALYERLAPFDVALRDPDRFVTKTVRACETGFWTAVLLFALLDFAAPRSTMIRLKTQGERSFMTAREWAQAAVVAVLNIRFSSLLLAPLVLVREYLYTREGITREADPLDWQRELVCLFLSYIVIDVWFYWTHRLLHWGPLYRHVHKMHHRFKAPTAIAAVYAHPVEFLLGNTAGVILGPLLTNAHPYTAYAWVGLCLCTTCASHSGYKAASAQKHDDHHKYVDCNYGVGIFCDWIFGTHFEGTEVEWARERRRRGFGQSKPQRRRD